MTHQKAYLTWMVFFEGSPKWKILMNKIKVNPKDPPNPKSYSSLKPQPMNQPPKKTLEIREYLGVNIFKAHDP